MRFPHWSLNFLNLARDGKILFLSLQNMQQCYLQTNNVKFRNKFEEISKTSKFMFAAFNHFSNSVGIETFKQSGKEFHGSITDYLSASARLFHLQDNEKKLVRSLDTEEKSISAITDSLKKDSEKRFAKSKLTAKFIILFVLIVGITQFAVLSFLLIRSISKQIQSLMVNMDEMGQGNFAFDDYDFRKR